MRSCFLTLLGWTAFIVLTTLAVTSVTVEAATWNSVTLTWTAPGDDGTSGRASQYDVRYSASNISGTDTTTWWNQATQCAGEPVPQSAGASESFIVTGLLSSTTYHFMIRTADEVPNWSGFSNVAVRGTTAAPDTVPPSPVRNLACAEEGNTIQGASTAEEGETEGVAAELAARLTESETVQFSLASGEICASVSPETQGKVSRAPDLVGGWRGWPVAFLEQMSRLPIDGGLV